MVNHFIKRLCKISYSTMYSDFTFINSNHERILDTYEKTKSELYSAPGRRVPTGISKDANTSDQRSPIKKKYRRNFSKSGKQESTVQSERRTTTLFTDREYSVDQEGSQNIKDVFRNPTGFRLPRISDKLRSLFNSSYTGQIPRSTRKIRSEDVSLEDEQAFSSYSVHSRRLPRGLLPLFATASILSFRDLGITEKFCEKFKRYTTLASTSESLKKNTNSGFPYFKKKNLDYVYKDAIDWLSRVKRKPNFYNIYAKNVAEHSSNTFGFDIGQLPAYIFHRFQVSMSDDSKTYDTKIRQVWCIPFRIIVLEHYFFAAVLKRTSDYIQLSSEPTYATGMRNYELSKKVIVPIRSLLRSSVPSKRLYSLDYSKYDRTLPTWGFDLFFGFFEVLLDFDSNKNKLFGFLRLYTKYTPFIYNGRVNFKKRGISSGSFITNYYDTWFNLLTWYVCDLLIHYYKDVADQIVYEDKSLFEIKFDYSKLLDVNLFKYRHDLKVCGDDVIIYTTQYEIELHKKIVMSLGMSIKTNEEIDDPDADFFFLGRYWNRNCEPDQTDEYMIAHIIERSSYIKEEDIPFPLDVLDRNRILSICLQFKSGLGFIKKYLMNYEPIRLFFEEKSGFHQILKFPEEDFRWKEFSEIYWWGNF